MVFSQLTCVWGSLNLFTLEYEDQVDSRALASRGNELLPRHLPAVNEDFGLFLLL